MNNFSLQSILQHLFTIMYENKPENREQCVVQIFKAFDVFLERCKVEVNLDVDLVCFSAILILFFLSLYVIFHIFNYKDGF